jgi:DNA-directed RNA polymerase specialized sigma24 family protein
MDMQEAVKDYKHQKEFHIFVASTFSDLEKFRKKGDKSEFNELLLKDLPQIKRYIAKRLNIALSKGNLPRGKYKTDDFLDQLFIEAFDHFEEVKNKEDLYLWLFKKADEILEDTIVDEEFDELFLKNIDDFSKPEWDEMEEKFSTDGDGDLVMMEDLDDISYRKNDYILNHVFVEDDNDEIIKKLDSEWGPDGLRKHTEMVLYHLPLPMRTVYELATEFHFDIEEIAKIRNHTKEEVRQLLESARKILETSFVNRMLR